MHVGAEEVEVDFELGSEDLLKLEELWHLDHAIKDSWDVADHDYVVEQVTMDFFWPDLFGLLKCLHDLSICTGLGRARPFFVILTLIHDRGACAHGGKTLDRRDNHC